MTFPLRIGTRRSRLALAQSGMMQRAIARALGVPDDEVIAGTLPLLRRLIANGMLERVEG